MKTANCVYVLALIVLGCAIGVISLAESVQAKDSVFTMRYVRVYNKTSEPIQVFIKYRTKTCMDCDFHWMPSSPEAPTGYVYTFQPGEAAYCAVNGKRIQASGLRWWAIGLKSKTKWTKFRNKIMWIVDKSYSMRRAYTAPEMETYTANLRARR